MRAATFTLREHLEKYEGLKMQKNEDNLITEGHYRLMLDLLMVSIAQTVSNDRLVSK
jgi:hypothetical protein